MRPPLNALRLLGGIDLGNVGQEVEDTAGVTPLVVVPRDQLDEVVVEGDTGLGIEDGGVGVAVKVRGDNVVLSVGQNTLEVTLRGLLDDLLDLVVRSTLLEANSQVNNGDVGGRDTHGHAGELAVELRDDLADSLGGTGAGGDDVLGSTTATSPVLGGRTIDGLLDTGGLNDVVGAGLGPLDVGGVTLRVELDGLAVDDEVVALVADLTLEDTVGRVVLEHVDLWERFEVSFVLMMMIGTWGNEG
ncbi:unnamed protein product [Fusarium graminearum]|nr:unnamed protein product [Fusarium graminearum]